MNGIKSTARILLLSLTFLGAACGSDNGDLPGEDLGGGIGEDHSFEITLVSRDNPDDTIDYSGTVPSDHGNAIYANRPAGEESIHHITMLLGEMEESGSIFAIVQLDDDRQPFPKFMESEGQQGTLMAIRPKGTNDQYVAVSGTLKFSELKYALVASTGGAASFILEFEGIFQKNGTEIGEGAMGYRGSGKITINPEKGFGTYK